MGDELGQFEVYLGRASASPVNVLQRFKAHQEDRKHPYAAILFSCPTKLAIEAETLGIKVLQALKERANCA